MKINMIYIGVDSAYGFQSQVLREIDQKLSFQKCVLLNKCSDAKDVYNDPKYIIVDYDICEQNRYAESYDFNTMKPLDKELLEKMQPYEETITRMFVRNMEQDIYTYDEGKRLYLMQLQFWNDVVQRYDINFVVINEVPHHAMGYVIYALCKINHIPMNVNISTTVPEHWLCGDDIYGQGERIYCRYQQLMKENKEIMLAEDLEHIYQALQYKNRGLDEKLVHGGITRKQHIAEQRAVFMNFILPANIIKRNFKYVKHGFAVRIKRKDKNMYKRQMEKFRQDLHFVKRARVKMKILRGNQYYESLTQPYHKEEKYVVYFLHYQPEATTLPRAGVFTEQILAIKILANALAEQGITVYVKEHFVQPYRHKYFYDDLAAIQGVKLLSCDIDSKQLLANCIAAATCTGTVIQEALVNKKPIFVFGDGGFTKGPCIYPISSTQECKAALADILAGKEISDYQVRAYFKAIELETVFMIPYIREIPEDDKETLEKNKRSFVKATVEAVNKLMEVQ